MDIYVSNDNLLTVDALRNAASGNYINNATVTAQLKDGSAVDVGSLITLSYVTASDGKYQGILEEDVAIVQQTEYVLHVDADATGDLKAHWEIPCSALVRQH